MQNLSRSEEETLFFLFVVDVVAGGFSESKDGVVTFPDISTTILEKICQYFYWSLQYSRFIIYLSFHLLLEFDLSNMALSTLLVFFQPESNYIGFSLVNTLVRIGVL